MTEESKILALSEQLLDVIDKLDFDTYSSFTAEDVTCFEAETKGMLVEGKPYLKWFIDNAPEITEDRVHKSNIIAPKVRPLHRT